MPEWRFHGPFGADQDHRQASCQKVHGQAGQAPDEKGLNIKSKEENPLMDILVQAVENQK